MYLFRLLMCLVGACVFSFSALSAQRLDSASYIPDTSTPDSSADSAKEPRPWTIYSHIAYGTNSAQDMDIVVPKTSGLHPTIILIHGGGWYEGDMSNLDDEGRRFAQKNFTVANINYRLATATGNNYPDGLNDCKSAVAFLVQHAGKYQIDVTKLTALGTSAGGNLALELGISHLVGVVIDFYGPTNFVDPVFLNEQYSGEENGAIVENYFGCTFLQDPDLYYNASPMNQVSATMVPTLIMQGSIDNVVPAEQSIDLYQELDAMGVDVKLHVFPGMGHGFLRNAPSPDAFLGEALRFIGSVYGIPTIAPQSVTN